MSVMDNYRQTLYQIAQASIEHGLAKGKPLTVNVSEYPLELQEERASFVTLHTQGNLRGCIGTIQAYQPLVTDIAYHAYAAAFSDSRFTPLQREELTDLSIHLSILSIPELLTVDSEEDLIQQLRPKIDGLILEEGWRRGTFLPSVWETLPNPHDFLRQLKRKAGFPADYWSKQIKVYRYLTEE